MNSNIPHVTFDLNQTIVGSLDPNLISSSQAASDGLSAAAVSCNNAVAEFLAAQHRDERDVRHASNATKAGVSFLVNYGLPLRVCSDLFRARNRRAAQMGL